MELRIFSVVCGLILFICPFYIQSTNVSQELHADVRDFITQPNREITITNNSVRVCYDFNDALISKLDSGMHWIRLDGFVYDSCRKPGGNVPYTFERTDIIRIPDGCSAKLVILSNPIKEYSSKKFGISQDNQSDLEYDQDFLLKNNIVAPPVISIGARTTGAYISKVDDYRGIKLLYINVYTNPQGNPYKVFSKIEYEVVFEKDNLSLSGSSKIKNGSRYEDLSFTNNFVLNKLTDMELDSIRRVYPSKQESLVVVSHPMHAESVSKLVEWKKRLGFNVKSIVKNDWTLTRLKEEIRDYYFSEENPKYIFIIGDNTQVPALSNTYSNNSGLTEDSLGYPPNHLTDFWTGVIDLNISEFTQDSDIKLPDLRVGRIPLGDVESVKMCLENIKNYESNPILDENFYQSHVLASFYESDTCAEERLDSAHELWNFIQISEAENRYLKKCDKEAIRIYKRYAEGQPLNSRFVVPTYYSRRFRYNYNCEYSELLPTELRSPEFFWDNDVESFKRNMDKFLIIYNGHGHINGIGRGTNHEFIHVPTTLYNGNRRPLMLSLACLTGAYHSAAIGGSIVENFLKDSIGGVIAMFAATAPSFLIQSNSIGIAMTEAIFPENDIEFTYGRYPNKNQYYLNKFSNHTLGDIIHYGLLNMRENVDFLTFKECFLKYGLFGDPTMIFHTAQPTPFHNVEIRRFNNGIRVVCDEPAKISIYMPESETNCYMESTDVYFDNIKQEDKFQISLLNHNKIPYFLEYDKNDALVFQNGLFIFDKNDVHKARKVYFGSNVEPNIAPGKVTIAGDLNIEAETVIIEPVTQISRDANINIVFK